MIAKLLCKSLISRPKVNRSLFHYTEKSGDSYIPIACDEPSCVSMRYLGYDPIRGTMFMWMIVHGPSPLQASSCNCLLEKCLKIESTPRIAGPFLAQMVLRGAVPDLLTFSLITKSYCKQFRYPRVVDAVLTQMKALGVEASISFYKNLMSGVYASFGPVVAYDLLKKVRASHQVPMPLSCFNVLVPHFFRRKHISDIRMGDVFVKVMLHMKRHRVFPDQKLVDAFLKSRYIFDDYFKRSEGIARQMLAEGIKIGVVQRVER